MAHSDDFKLIDQCCDSTTFTSSGALEFGCCCEDSCSDEDLCICLAQHLCFYDRKEKLAIDKVSEPLYECNQCCECAQTCLNRVVQRGSNLQLKVTETDDKGYGLVTLELIPKGTFVIEYLGQRITKIEAANRLFEQREQNTACYIFALLEHYGDTKLSYFVDASKTGNLARFINHSCEPNLTMVPVRINQVEPVFALFAAKDIEKDTELSFSYGTVDVTDKTTTLKKCFCGTQSCKGYLPYNPTVTVK